MGDSVQLQLAGETVELLGERALYRPAHRALLIADLHLARPMSSGVPVSACRPGAPRTIWNGWMRCSHTVMSRRSGSWATCCTARHRARPGIGAGAPGASSIARCA